MSLDFPNAPRDGEPHTDPSNGITYIYDLARNAWTDESAGGGIGAGGVGDGLHVVNDKITVLPMPGKGIGVQQEGVLIGDDWSSIPDAT